MHANEVKNLKWIPVTDWSKLMATRFNFFSNPLVGKSDVESFAEVVFKDVAQKLNIPYTELEPILKEANSEFYSANDKLFKQFYGLPQNDKCLFELKQLLLIPDVTSIPNVIVIPEHVNKSAVDKILNDFSALTDKEKLEVLQRLCTVSVKVEFFAE